MDLKSTDDSVLFTDRVVQVGNGFVLVGNDSVFGGDDFVLVGDDLITSLYFILQVDSVSPVAKETFSYVSRRIDSAAADRAFLVRSQMFLKAHIAIAMATR